MPTSAGSGYLLTSDANGVGTWQANSSPQLPTGTEGQTLYNNAGTWASNSGLFYDDTNNRVGIGTTNPQEKIHIGGGIGFDVGLYGVNHYIIQPSSDQLNLGIGYIVNNNWYPSGLPAIAIRFDGKIGIGTTNPGTQLMVSSNGWDNARGITIENSGSSAAGAQFAFTKSRGTALTPVIVINGDYTGSYFFKNYDGTSYLTNALFGARVNGTVTGGSIPTDLYFATSATSDGNPFASGKVRMLITSEGNVGIGTTAPDAVLEVLKNTIAETKFQLTNPNAGTGAFSSIVLHNATNYGSLNFFGSGFTSGGTAYQNGLRLWTDGAGGISFAAGHSQSPIRFFSGGASTSSVIIDKDGKVGIGTTSPGAPLNVVGLAGNPPVYLDVYEGTSTSQIAVRAARGTPELPTALLLGNMVGGFSARGYATTGFTAGAKGALQIRASENWTDSANGTYMSLWTTATGGTGITEKMRLQNSGGLSLGASYLTTDPGAGSMIISGNVGIGTTSPGSILDVVGTAQMTGLKLTTSPTAGYVITSDASGTGTWQAATGVTSSGSANYIPKFTSGSAIGDSAIYDSSGNIGIGTTSPSARVEIKGVNDIFQLIVRANATQSNTNPLIQLQKSDGTPFLGLVAIMIPTYLLVRIRGE